MSYTPPARGLAPLVAAMAALAVLRPGPTYAQGTSVKLDEIVVDGPAGQPGGPGANLGLQRPTPTALLATPTGQVQTIIGPDRTVDTRAFSVSDLLIDSPGINVKQGNGPRDFGISIRGSNARNGFGIRNIVMFDDGFQVTQPDGLSRSDLIDPHAYGSVDVVRGPSSALYGNYATGGAINFRTRPGRVIDGLELGTDFGSFGYLNNYLTYGRKVGNVEASVFASNVLGDSRTTHSEFNTQTVNALLTWQITPEDRLTFKLIENRLNANLSNRLSLDQFNQNPYQRGCVTAASPIRGCQTINLFQNGFNAPTIAQSAEQAGFGRNDNRAIFGARLEHDFGTAATWRNQVTFDDRNIRQPVGTTSAIGDYFSVNVISDVVGHGPVFGLAANHYAALFVNTMSPTAYTFNLAPGGNGTLGGIAQIVPSTTTNFGGRVREEVALTNRLTFVAGVGVERTALTGRSTAFTYSAPFVVASSPIINASRNFLNTAPEVSLTYRPLDAWQITGRVATGYGTPQVGNLFVGADGIAGNNTDLKAQTNLGYDLAVTYQPSRNLTLTVDGFYEFFRNELVTQSPGAGLLNFTFNAPRSEHRGVEAAAKWAFSPGWLATVAYTYDNQIYREYDERLSAGTFSTLFNRAGNRIPGVPLNTALVRLGYDVPTGTWRGLGAYVEYVKQDGFFIDNANLLNVPGYDLVNLNLHYTKEFAGSSIRSLTAYVEARNITNQTYVAAANNVVNSLDATTGRQNPAATVAATSGSIYAGIPVSIYGGVRVRF